MKTVRVYYTKLQEALVEIEDKEYEFLSQEGIGLPTKKLVEILSNINRQLEDDVDLCAVWDETDQTCLLEI